MSFKSLKNTMLESAYKNIALEMLRILYHEDRASTNETRYFVLGEHPDELYGEEDEFEVESHNMHIVLKTKLSDANAFVVLRLFHMLYNIENDALFDTGTVEGMYEQEELEYPDETHKENLVNYKKNINSWFHYMYMYTNPRTIEDYIDAFEGDGEEMYYEMNGKYGTKVEGLTMFKDNPAKSSDHIYCIGKIYSKYK